MRTRSLLVMALALAVLSGCKFYGGALPPENPVSMDEALRNSSNRTTFMTQDGKVIEQQPRPAIHRPSYVPEKELAVVAPPRTLLVWTYPHITDDNTRVFGGWSTIFLQERYEWVPPINELPAAEAN